MDDAHGRRNEVEETYQVPVMGGEDWNILAATFWLAFPVKLYDMVWCGNYSSMGYLKGGFYLRGWDRVG